MKLDNLGTRQKPIDKKTAFDAASTHGRAMRCDTFRYFSSGWCSVRAKFVGSLAFSCNYGRQRNDETRKDRKLHA